jgi:hypothetical protein
MRDVVDIQRDEFLRGTRRVARPRLTIAKVFPLDVAAAVAVELVES